jgi:multidrug efflux system membrane fusion protein
MQKRKRITLSIIRHQFYRMKIILYISYIQLLLFPGCSNNEYNNVTSKVIPVAIAAVTHESIFLPIHAAGLLSEKKEMRLSFKTGGIVDKIYVKEGSQVKKGDILAKLKLDEMQAIVIQAQNTLEKAERDLRRINNLYADSVTTLEQKQDAETALNIANANYKIAEFNLLHSKIVAPEDGKVLKQFIEVNELVSPGLPIFYFGTSEEEWIVKVGITDRDIIKINPGDSAAVSFDAYPQVIFPACVTEIAQTIDPLSGTYEVELEIIQMHYRLMSGFVATVDIYPKKQKKYDFIPIEALVEADEESGYIFTIVSDNENKVAKKRAVKLGPIYKDKVIINSGLENIDYVITKGSVYLSDGMKVELMR